MPRSIRWRLVTSYVLLAVLVVSLVGVVAISLVRRSLEQQEMDALTSNAQVIAYQVRSRLPVPGHSNLQQLAQVAAFMTNTRVRILDSNKTVLADSGPREDFTEAMLLDPGTDLAVGNMRTVLSVPLIVLPSGKSILLPSGISVTAIRRSESPWGSQIRFAPHINPSDATANSEPPSGAIVTVPISDSDAVGYVELSGGPDFGAQAIATTQWAFLWGGLAAAVIAVGVGLLVSRGLTVSLAGLGAAARRMSTGDLGARPFTGKDEVGQLAAQFNQMADRLQTNFSELQSERDTLRRFVADASHELRTPMTALQTFTDLMQGPAADDAAARTQFLNESQVQLNRLEWITRNLLDLSRLDAGIEALDLAVNDAVDLTRSAAAPFVLQAQKQGAELTLDLPDLPLEITCDCGRVEMALSNLVQNALKFTPGGHIAVKLEALGSKQARWTISDDGPGIESQDLPHIFERFYRGAHPGVDGSGLGLALVQSVAHAHGGQVSVESTPGAGSTFTLVI